MWGGVGDRRDGTGRADFDFLIHALLIFRNVAFILQ